MRRISFHYRFLWTVSVVVALLSFAPTASGQEEGQYEERIQNALAEYDAGNWLEAYQFFKAAHEASPNARTLRGMGMASFELREYPRAVAELRASLEHEVKPLTSSMREQVQALIERASHLVGTLEVELTPKEARLFVDRKRTKKRRLLVSVGEVALRASLEGYQPVERVVSVDGGEHYPLHLKLSPKEGAASKGLPNVEDAQANGSAGPDARQLDLAGEGTTPPADDTNVLESPWLWGGVGAVVVGGIITAVVLGTRGGGSGDSFPEGNVGVSYRALQERGR